MSEISGVINKKKQCREEVFYFAGFFLFMLFHLFKNVNYSFNEIFLDFFKYLSLLFSFLYFFLSLWRYSARWKIFILFIILLSIIVGLNSVGFRNQLLMTPLLVFGAKGIDFRKILKFTFLVNTIFCISVIILHFLGFIDNYEIVEMSREAMAGAVVRNTFGYVWPTNLANHIFFILLMFWILKKGKLSIFLIFLYCLIIYLVFIFTDSKLGCGCIFLLLIMTALLKIRRENFIKTYPKLSLFFVFWVPFAAALTYYVTLKYDATDPFWIVSDMMLTGRLHISQETIVQYGIPLLGQKLMMYGGDMNGDLYNYVDSAYLQMFVLWGIIYTIFYLLGYFIIGVRCYKDKNEIMLLAIFVAGLTGVFAQHFMEIYMNPLLLALMASFFCKKMRQNDSEYLKPKLNRA